PERVAGGRQRWGGGPAAAGAAADGPRGGRDGLGGGDPQPRPEHPEDPPVRGDVLLRAHPPEEGRARRHPPAGAVEGPAARSPPGIYHLGAVREQPSPPGGERPRGPRPDGADAAARRSGGAAGPADVRPVRPPDDGPVPPAPHRHGLAAVITASARRPNTAARSASRSPAGGWTRPSVSSRSGR